MKTELVFFDNVEESVEGTKRGFIAFLTLILLNAFWFHMKNYGDLDPPKINIFSSLFVLLLLCSAIAVQKSPDSMTEAMTYGALVGFVVYGVYNSKNSDHKPLKLSILHTFWGCFTCSVASLMVFVFY